jgi:hypothetical protein
MLRLAIKDSLSLLHLRWSIVRSSKTKLSLWVGIIMIALAITGASYTGQLVRYMAQDTSGNNKVVQTFAITYLESYLRGELGTLVSVTLGIAIISVAIAPFTGNSITSLISYHHLVSIRSSQRHRFTDSFISQLFSSISILQLLTLTAIASLLTLDGGRIQGVLYAWGSWPVLIALSTMFVWIAEYLYRKFGEKLRLTLMGVVAAGVGAAILIDPMHGKTVFGIGSSYAYIIQHFNTFDSNLKLFATGFLVILFVGISWLAYVISMKTLAQAERQTKRATGHNRKVRPWKTSRSPLVEMIHLCFVQLWRSMEIRKPLILATIFGAIMIYYSDGAFAIAATMILIIPLIVSLSWGSNVFGVLGNGYIWLSSLPGANRYIIWTFASVQTIITFVLFSIMCLPSILFGHGNYLTFSGLILALLSTSILMTRSALTKSVNRPYAYKAGTRGENILPPAAMINYTLRFSLWAGLYGIGTIVASNILIQLALTFLAFTWSIFRLSRLNNRWQTEHELRANVVHIVAND